VWFGWWHTDALQCDEITVARHWHQSSVGMHVRIRVAMPYPRNMHKRERQRERRNEKQNTKQRIRGKSNKRTPTRENKKAIKTKRKKKWKTETLRQKLNRKN
jgi:hypothetical protein